MGKPNVEMLVLEMDEKLLRRVVADSFQILISERFHSLQTPMGNIAYKHHERAPL